MQWISVKLDSNGEWEFCNQALCMPNYGAYLDIEYHIDIDEITHWMPLPDPPRKEDIFNKVQKYINENICKEDISKYNLEYRKYYKKQ